MTDFNVGAKVDSVSKTNGIEEMESALKGVATQSNAMADTETAVSSATKKLTSYRAIKAGIESIITSHP